MIFSPVIFNSLVLLALPLIVSNIISASSGLITMYFIAMIHPQALAAGAIITSTYSLVMMMTVSILYSVSVLVGQHAREGREKDVGAIVFSGITVAVMVGIPVSCLLFWIQPILVWLRQPVDVSVMVGEYFYCVAYGFIPTLVSVVLTQLFMGLSKTKLIFYFAVVGVLLNSLLSALLIFGIGSFKPMGIFGAGLSMGLSSCALLLLQSLALVFCSEFKTYRLLSKDAWRLSYCRVLFNIGFPMSIQYTVELLAFAVVTYLMGVIGTKALVAQQITLQCSILAVMISMGFAQSSAILVSQHIAPGLEEKRKQISVAAFILGGVVMLSMGLAYCFFSKGIISFYLPVDDPSFFEMVSLAQAILMIAALTQVFDAGRHIAAGLLRGYGETKFSMWIGLVSCWVIGLPLAIGLAFIFDWGARGLKLGMMGGILFGCYQLMRRIDWMNKKT